ncbi:MAG: hypothetical protein ACR2HZ_08975 [Gemmatimonadaceae bacterium]
MTPARPVSRAPGLMAALGEFASLVARARDAAKRAGIGRADVAKAVSKVRRSR